MKTNPNAPLALGRHSSIAVALFLLPYAPGLCAYAQGTAFTYQGRLTDDGTPYTGNAEFQPTLWDAASGGAPVATNSPASVIVGVTNGLFLLPLDFGANFPGANRWLQLDVRTTIAGFTPLAPRQPLKPTPYALTASNLSGTLPATQLTGTLPTAQFSGTYSSPVMLNNPANSFSGGGSGLTQLDASQLAGGTVPDARLAANVARTNQVWLLGGNGGTTPGTQFLGTTDNQPVEIKVNGVRGLRLEPTSSNDTVNVIGGSARNFVGAGVVGATIGGGGTGDYYGRDNPNSIWANFGVIGGGYGNSIDANSGSAIIAGGFQNTVGTNAAVSAIGGGTLNTIAANSLGATIPGGLYNLAGADFAFAAGQRAHAIHQGTFVWADSQNTSFDSTAANQFLIRAAGGVGIGLNNPAGAALAVDGGIRAGGNGTIQRRVQFGSAAVGTGTNGVNTFTITFPSIFSTAPKVFAAARGIDAPDTFVINTRAVTRTNFKVNIIRVDANVGWGQPLQVDWYAVE